ncbi:hypothetical protein QQF64_032866 [Cirrhinus molitorella]|uniref:Zona pellucida glycoprotein 3 n=1 Tax=Cirrhinus molitorella TaxID=172907 RepID=A0ABR3MSA2_9TELE
MSMTEERGGIQMKRSYTRPSVIKRLKFSSRLNPAALMTLREEDACQDVWNLEFQPHITSADCQSLCASRGSPGYSCDKCHQWQAGSTGYQP